MLFLHKEKAKRGSTGKFLAKYNKFSSDMNPAPLSKPIKHVSGKPRMEGPEKPEEVRKLRLDKLNHQ